MVAAVPLLEKTLLTEAEYAELGDLYEIIDGELVERMPMATYSVIVRDNIYKIIDGLAEAHDTGYALGDGVVYLMWKQERGIKGAYIPDVSYIRKANIIPEWSFTTHYPGTPDLAIEVVSKNDNADQLQTKVRGYLERGTEQVWVIYPETREILLYRRDELDIARIFRGETSINASAFFPGVEIALADIFKLPRRG